MTRPPIFVLLAVALAMSSLSSCNKDSSSRNESINVFLDDFDNEVTGSAIDIAVTGGTHTILIKSDADIHVDFQQSVNNPSWISVGGKYHSDRFDCDAVDITVKPMTSSLTRKYGSLNITSPDIYLGKFIYIRQGFASIYNDTFSLFKNGSTIPTVSGGEKNLEQWSAAQTAIGYTSTVISGQEHSYCYAKNGYLRLGSDDGFGADLISPYIADIYKDSVVVVAFMASAYTSAEGVTDQGDMTFEIVGGGVIAGTDESSTTFEAKSYAPDAMTAFSEQNLVYFFVSSSPKNPITTSTRFRIIAGSLSRMSKNNRVYIDNLYVYSVPATYYYLLDK